MELDRVRALGVRWGSEGGEGGGREALSRGGGGGVVALQGLQAVTLQFRVKRFNEG